MDEIRFDGGKFKALARNIDVLAFRQHLRCKRRQAFEIGRWLKLHRCVFLDKLGYAGVPYRFLINTSYIRHDMKKVHPT